MGITTTTSLPAPIQQSFSMKLLSVPVPLMIHSIPAEKKRMPANGGRVIRFRRYNALATAPVPLGNTGIAPPPQSLTALDLDAQINFYGTYIILNEQVTLQNQDPALNEAVARLSVSMRQTEDQLMREMLLSTAAQINCLSGTNGDNPTNISKTDIDFVVRTLVGNDAHTFVTGKEGVDKLGTAPIRDCFFALGHTDLLSDLEGVDKFIQKWNYPNQQNVLESEWGIVSNLRFLLSSQGSITPNASLNGRDVYNVFCCAKESYAGIEQDNYSAHFVYRDPMLTGIMALNAEVGWKMSSAQRILNDAWVLNMRCSLR